MNASRNILVVSAVDDEFSRRIVRGAARYARARPSMRLSLDRSLPAKAAPRRVDGVLAVLRDRAQLASAMELPVPVVNVSGRLGACPLPQVLGDDEAIARMAIDHLRRRGFERFGYVGYRDLLPSRTRQSVFAEAAGGRCSALDLAAATGDEVATITEWLTSLRRPAGVLAFNDGVGLKMTEACRLVGIDVPNELAIVGVDDDRVLCELAAPTLSSIYPATLQRGARAARLLDDMIGRAAPPPEPIRVGPDRVIQRGSSDTLAFGDPELRKAMSFLRTHACDPIEIDDVMEAVACSRRTLEKRFRTALGCTIGRQIWKLRLDRARALLAETDLTITHIALRCGSASASAFTQSFQRYAGQSPSSFRRERSGDSDPSR
jgi:LacI family transcriptional regulator